MDVPDAPPLRAERGERTAVRLALGAYGAAMEAVTWTALVPFEAAREAFGPARAATVRQRLGRWVPPGTGTRPLLLFHAVSVGEMAAAEALLLALRGELAGFSAVVTAGNRDGLAAAEALAARRREVRAVSLLPWDRPGRVRRWLQRLAPDAVCVVETELWPGLFLACRDLGVPLLVVNGRIYPRDVPRYRIARAFFREVLGAAAWIGVQTEAERSAFVEVGADPARVAVTGNLKLDLPVADAPLPAPWSEALADGAPLVVAGSTHAGEERVLLAAISRLRERVRDVRLVVAPRHPRRAAAIAEEARRAGLAAALWSRPERGVPFDVVVVDAFGLLPALYARATAAFVGGSLVPRGGQSPVEPAARGVPVVSGPDLTHFAEVASALERAGGLTRVAGLDPAVEIASALEPLLTDEGARRAAGERAREAVGTLRGAASLSARAVADHLRRAQTPSSGLP